MSTQTSPAPIVSDRCRWPAAAAPANRLTSSLDLDHAARNAAGVSARCSGRTNWSVPIASNVRDRADEQLRHGHHRDSRGDEIPQPATADDTRRGPPLR